MAGGFSTTVLSEYCAKDTFHEATKLPTLRNKRDSPLKRYISKQFCLINLISVVNLYTLKVLLVQMKILAWHFHNFLSAH